MHQKYIYFLISICLMSCNLEDSPRKKVDPFIGTGGHGHTFPGACSPFGMIQISPDTRLEGWDGCSGYHYSDSILYGFSHTHLSGTGVSDYGDFLLTPQTGKFYLTPGDNNARGYRAAFSHENETALPGFYSVELNNGIRIETLAGKRSGKYKIDFPSGDRFLSLDLEHRDELLDYWIKFPDSKTMVAHRRSTAWAKDQRLFFAARFDHEIEAVMVADGKEIQWKDKTLGVSKIALRFGTGNQPLEIDVAISAVNERGALGNLNAESLGRSFEDFEGYADSLWKDELEKIVVKGAGDLNQIKFYSALYHSMIAPNLYSDADLSYRGRDLKVHRGEGDYYSVFSLWDTYRALHPLMSIIEPERTTDWMKTLLLQYQQGGTLPVWELSANETMCMIGYHSVPVLVDAAIKGIDGFDKELALEASIYSSNLNHLGLSFYKSYGFIPAGEEPESVSKTLEYAYDDWCIAKLAEKLGKDSIAHVYFKRSQNWKNLFDPGTGFFRAKINNGFIDPFIPEEVNFHYTEANAWHYSMYVPHAVPEWIEFLGGKKKLEIFLDRLFSADEKTEGRNQADITGLIGQYAHGNEPSQHMAYLYNYTDSPWKGQKMVRRIMDELYFANPNGLPGNEDCGQMSAWFVLSSLGFYQVCPGSNLYQIGSPLFEMAEINVGSGRAFEIHAKENSDKNVFVQSVKLNDEPLNRNFIYHGEILNGGKLEFLMGPEPSDWGKGTVYPKETLKGELVPVPYLVKDTRSFKESTMVEFGHALSPADIYYSVDGGNHIKYKEPFEIKETTEMRYYAEFKGKRSATLVSRIVKMPANRNIKIKYPFANQYSAGGEEALIDGILGGPKFATGDWQGYHIDNLEAVVDFGKELSISKVTLRFIQDWNSWIYFPKQVQVFSSDDSLNWDLKGVYFSRIPPEEPGSIIQEFTVRRTFSSRFIKVVGINRGKNPEWHRAPGDGSWIFVDEIQIQ